MPGGSEPHAALPQSDTGQTSSKHKLYILLVMLHYGWVYI